MLNSISDVFCLFAFSCVVRISWVVFLPCRSLVEREKARVDEHRKRKQEKRFVRIATHCSDGGAVCNCSDAELKAAQDAATRYDPGEIAVS